jgi:Zn-finger nucleic acid-binding protein
MRDGFATCPRCKVALDPRGTRWVCAPCGGILLAEADISQLIADMLGNTLSLLGWSGKIAEPQPLKLVDRPAEDALTCPRCTAGLAPHLLYGIKVDRCGEHGLWFDREELEQVLRAAGAIEKQRAGVGEKVFGIAFVTAYIAAQILTLIAA